MPLDMAKERADALLTLTDPTHWGHRGARIFCASYDTGDTFRQAFMRRLAPYMFESDGTPIWHGLITPIGLRVVADPAPESPA